MRPEDIHMPDEALSESFLAATGPGGQNVNKVATAVQLRVDVCLGLHPDVYERLKTIAGMGIISTRKHSGNRTARSIAHPTKNMTAPPMSRIKDKRERKSSAPKVPTSSIASEITMIGNPHIDGSGWIVPRRMRFCQTT